VFGGEGDDTVEHPRLPLPAATTDGSSPRRYTDDWTDPFPGCFTCGFLR
jgi:hypothetical protein